MENNYIIPQKLDPIISKFCLTIGLIPTSYLISLTYEEQVLYIGKYIEDSVIPALNNNAEAVAQLQAAYVDLKDYVDNYFENLDVQEEINNKLDEMAETGALQELVNNIFETLEDEISDLRTDLEDEIGDLSTLGTLDKTKIVNAINNTNFSQSIHLGTSITYDIPESDIGHIQGCTVNGSTLYVAVQGGTSYPNGTIYLFNIESNTYIGKYENIPFYHCNSMTYLDGKLYIACTDDKSICVYDIASGTSSLIDPVASDTSVVKSTAVEKFGSKLLCWLEASGDTANLNNDKFIVYNPISLEIEDTYQINDIYNLIKFSNAGIVRQSYCIYDGFAYMLLQQPNVIVRLQIDNTNKKLVPLKLYNIPAYNFNNIPIGETEDIAYINNSNYPEGSFIINTRINKGLRNDTYYGHDTLMCHIFNPFLTSIKYSNMAFGYYQRALGNQAIDSVSKTAIGNSLIEVGNSTYPFKDIMRGIQAIRGTRKGRLAIRDSSNYYIPYLFGVENLEIIINSANIHPTIYIGTIENCNITIRNERNDSDITLKSTESNNRITLLNSNLKCLADNYNKIIFADCQVQLQMTNFEARHCSFVNTISVSSGYLVQVINSSHFIDGFDTMTPNGTDKPVYVASNAVAFLSASRVYTKDGYTFIGLLV